MTYVVGAFAGHEGHIALVGEGRVVHFEGERWSRKRHHDGWPAELLDPMLAHAEVSRRQIAALVTVSGDLFCGLCVPYWRDLRDVPRAWSSYLRCGISTPYFQVPHHTAHAAYAFYSSPYESCRVIAMDGAGDGFEVAPGQVFLTDCAVGRMAQPFGATKLSAFELQHRQLGIGGAWINATHDIVAKRYAEGTLMAMGGVPAERFEELTGRSLSDRATIAELQRRTTATFAACAGELGTHGHVTPLVLGGGCALNGIAAYELLRANHTRQLWVPPAVSDEGLAIGACMLVLHHVLGVPRVRYEVETVAFAGYTEPAIEAEPPIDVVIDALAEGKTVAVVHGRAESGPRALGHRSILADPRVPGMRERLNRIKGRASFRPSAPAVLRRFGAELFELYDAGAYEFMTCIATAKPAAYGVLPEGIHYDGSARVQLCDESTLLGRVLEAWYARTGCPALLNTSFNVGGEAMANSRDHAHDTFNRSEIDLLVCGSEVVVR